MNITLYCYISQIKVHNNSKLNKCLINERTYKCNEITIDTPLIENIRINNKQVNYQIV